MVSVSPTLTFPCVVIACDPKLGEIFVPSIAAALLTSAFTILSSLIFALVLVTFRNAPPEDSFVC